MKLILQENGYRYLFTEIKELRFIFELEAQEVSDFSVIKYRDALDGTFTAELNILLDKQFAGKSLRAYRGTTGAKVSGSQGEYMVTIEGASNSDAAKIEGLIKQTFEMFGYPVNE